MRKLHPHQEIVGLSGLTIEDFWIWGYSDMLTNVVRNTFAEFMVGFVLGRLHTPKIGQDRVEFDYRDRLVAVRAAAFVQSAPQKKKSKVNFDIQMRPTGAQSVVHRAMDCYVFCLFTCMELEDKNAARNALIDTANWLFYVFPPADLAEVAAKKTAGVRWIETHCPNGAVKFPQLKRRIDEILGFPP